MSPNSAYYEICLPLPERKFIENLRRAVARQSARRSSQQVIKGIGDDCAVLRIPAEHEVLVTTDFSLEGVHFRRDWHPPEIVGHRCLTRGLSDIAAMGGEPVAAFLSLALPRKLSKNWVDEFLRGLISLTQKFSITLAGGDTAASPNSVLADIVVLGSVPKGQAVLRSSARPGDQIYVTGSLGGSAAALRLLISGKKILPAKYPQQFRPMPRIEVGRALRVKKIAASMIDISDGLSTDLSHICEESDVGAEVWEDKLPRSQFRNSRNTVEVEDALHGGDDYELLFTARPETRVPRSIAGVPITRIGKITRTKTFALINSSGNRLKLEVRGWEHFIQIPIK